MAEPMWVQLGRYGYLILAGFFVICVLVQIYIAGMAVFIDPSNWSLHTTFVHAFVPMLFILVVLALIGRLPRSLKVAPIGLFLLVAFQYMTAARYGSLVAAIHPVNAVVIFVVSALAVRRAWKSIPTSTPLR
ncbi:DUF6220 domain-containing protein [Halosolutus gelatinilyticus]|uniref:DUF6220 domain-containing protein n=1 Tax=Halosolutus gelatinilyticus TaxID=2931975 RepID=UPI001FF5BB49|nr:DUF6220 domain-containing protein [Halosolutus gelatinilyticus]